MQSYKKLCGLMLFALSTNGFVMPAFAAVQARVANVAQKKKEEKKNAGVTQRVKSLGAGVSNVLKSALRAGNSAVRKVVSGAIVLGAAGTSVYVWNKNKAAEVPSKGLSQDGTSKEDRNENNPSKQQDVLGKSTEDFDALVNQKVSEGCSLAEAKAFAAETALSEAEAQVATFKKRAEVAEKNAREMQSRVRKNGLRQARVAGNNTRRLKAMKATNAELELQLANERKVGMQKDEDAEMSRRILRDAMCELSEADVAGAEVQENLDAMSAELEDAVTDYEKAQEELVTAALRQRDLQDSFEQAEVDWKRQIDMAAGWTRIAELNEDAANDRIASLEARLEDSKPCRENNKPDDFELRQLRQQVRRLEDELANANKCTVVLQSHFDALNPERKKEIMAQESDGGRRLLAQIASE